MQKTGCRSILLVIAILALTMIACRLTASDGPPRNAVTIGLTASSNLRPWLESAVGEFNDGKTKVASGKPIYVWLDLVESGQAVSSMAGGGPLPELWVPDDPVWVTLLADRGDTSFQGNCISLAESPLVIAMWRPVAEALGWPGRSLGWLDVGSLAADPSAWTYYSGGQFGETLRLGHTHPGLSASGVSTLLAIVQAAESKQEAVGVDDIQQPIVQASVSAFEAAVSWFSASTDDLGQAMSERGISYLGAAVMYESTVVSYGSGEPSMVPIYPFEGTFVATYPACLNTSADAETQEAAILFRDYLLGEEVQTMAVAKGLRPVTESALPDEPPYGELGVDWGQPDIVFGPPSVDTVYAVQSLWQSARKNVNLVMLFDTSGSMSGRKIEGAQQAAMQFVEQMGDDDLITIVAFSDVPTTITLHEQVGDARSEVVQSIAGLQAHSDTALYDAIGDAATIIADTTSSRASNVILLLTDGLDTNSSRYQLDEHLIEMAAGNDTTVFAVAYGNDADEDVLSDIALRTNGNFYLGDEASISAIYQEMSAAFGGTVGVGR